MSRSRNIKPGFFENEILAGMPYEQRLLFIGLWTMADREGRFEDRPTRIKMKLFPADGLDVDAGLQSLHDEGFILRYEVDGKRYCQVLAWGKHQSPHFKEQKSTIPAPGKPEASNRLSVPHETSKASGKPSTCRADSLIPDSLQEKELPPTAGAIAPEPADPIFGVGLDFLKRKGLREGSARSFLGLLRKELHDDLTVAELLVEAERQDVSQPQAWLTQAAKQRKAQGPTHGNRTQGGGRLSVVERIAKNNADAERRESSGSGTTVEGEFRFTPAA